MSKNFTREIVGQSHFFNVPLYLHTIRHLLQIHTPEYLDFHFS